MKQALIVIDVQESLRQRPYWRGDELPAFLKNCRALMAPIRTGGGVRVKLLDAACQGLPVVGTDAAVGSLKDVFGMSTFDDDDVFVAECRRMLLDRDIAATGVWSRPVLVPAAPIPAGAKKDGGVPAKTGPLF